MSKHKTVYSPCCCSLANVRDPQQNKILPQGCFNVWQTFIPRCQAHPKLQFIHKTHKDKVQHAHTLRAAKQNATRLFVTFQLPGYLVDGINLVHREQRVLPSCVKLTLSFAAGEKSGVVLALALCAWEVFCFVCSPALQHGSSQSSWLIVPLSRTHYCPADNPLSYGVWFTERERGVLPLSPRPSYLGANSSNWAQFTLSPANRIRIRNSVRRTDSTRESFVLGPLILKVRTTRMRYKFELSPRAPAKVDRTEGRKQGFALRWFLSL